jgi:multicomponent Na+:H+ antiporter subunit G
VTAVLADALTVLGLLVLTIAVYGLVRMPDVYTQLHAASKAGFLGVAALLAGAAIGNDVEIGLRGVLIVVLLTLTTPVAAHAVARAARERGEPQVTPGAVDET